jgi:hypothetical protein
MTMVTNFRRVVWSLAGVIGSAAVVMAQQAGSLGYQNTPMQPDGKWHIHDGLRPQPKVVDPGPASATPAPPPADAIVLIGAGSDTSAWQMMNGNPITWVMKDGILPTGTGMIRTKAEFSNFQLHVEFATPTEPKGDGQGRGNSGVYLAGKYEVQVLDSFNNPTYPDGMAASLYGQFPPMVNASRGPGQWQTYDIAFTAPVFKDAALAEPARVTVFHNGVLVHMNQAFWGPTQHQRIDPYRPADVKGPISLQDHGNPVRYRNVWIRPITE